MSYVDFMKLSRTHKQHVPDVSDSLGGIQALRAYVDTVLDAMTAKHAERVIELGQPLISGSIAAVSQEPVGLQQARWADEAIRVPPE